MLFLIIFNRSVAEAVAAAYDGLQCRSAGGKPPTATASLPSNRTGKKPSRGGAADPGLGAVAAVLSLLQREARFVDFLMEDIDPYPDASVGVAARSVHRGSRKALKEYIELQPVRSEKEGDTLTVEPGFDPSAIRLMGKVTGNPPFQGVLRHPGWRIVKANVPTPPPQQDRSIVMPAEVEV